MANLRLQHFYINSKQSMKKRSGAGNLENTFSFQIWFNLQEKIYWNN